MDKITFRRLLRRVFWVPMGITLGLAVTLIFEVQYLARRAAWVEHTDVVIAVSEKLVIPLCILAAAIPALFGQRQMRTLARSFNAALDAEQKSAEESRRQREWFRTTLCSIGDAVVATDEQGAVTFINPAAEALTVLSLHRESRTPTMITLCNLLEGVVALIEETMAKGKRRFEVYHGFKDQIEGYPAELRQVFTNVIKNAVEATPEGGSIVVVSVPVENGHQGVMVEITDDGAGIPDHMQSRLFSPFATTKEQSGTGLGLWVSRSIVERHGGNVHITSRADARPGTTVSIFLPLLLAD